MRRLFALLILVSTGCAGTPIPCPSELNVYGGREWGEVDGTRYTTVTSAGKHGKATEDSFSSGGKYRGYQAGAGLTFDLQTRRGACPFYGGSPEVAK